MIKWTNEQRAIADLIPANYNPRKWSDDDVNRLTKSIDTFQLVDPIIINRNNVVIGGHFRLTILKAKGVATVDVRVRVPDRMLDQEEERELNIRLNKNSGQWDFDILRGFDEDLLKTIGFESKELDRIFKPEHNREDDKVPVKRATKIVVGDVFKLGEHRLICGDATNAEHVKALMGDERASLIFTDPPYNVNYSGQGEKTSNTIANDNMPREAFLEFLKKSFSVMESFLGKGGLLYTCYASRTHREFEDALEAAGFEIKNQIIWVKLVASMGWGDYRWKHEPMLYAHRKGDPTDFYGDRKQYTTWDQEMDDTDLLAMVKRMITKEENGNSTVWRLGRDNNYDHPTQKPIALIEKALVNSSKRGEIVADFFGGSGSTLIACEKLNRRARVVEVDPSYCQVIIGSSTRTTGQHR